MTTTITRVRERRGGRSRLRERVPGDATAPKRRRLKASGTVADLLTPAAPRAPAKTRLVVRGRRPRAADDPASPPARGDSIATRLAKAARGTRSGRDREKRKLARIRDGRYAPGRARFVV